jgi:hypothetical protein
MGSFCLCSLDTVMSMKSRKKCSKYGEHGGTVSFGFVCMMSTCLICFILETSSISVNGTSICNTQNVTLLLERGYIMKGTVKLKGDKMLKDLRNCSSAHK